MDSRPPLSIVHDTDYFADVFVRPNADWTSFIHEGARLFLAMYSDAARLPGADRAIKQDYQTLLDWFEVKTWEGLSPGDRQWYSDLFAAEFERYVSLRASPVVGAHETFADWLNECQTHTSAGLSAVFDRLLGVSDCPSSVDSFDLEESVIEAAASAGIKPPADRVLGNIYGAAYRRLYEHTGMSPEAFLERYAVRFLPDCSPEASDRLCARVGDYAASDADPFDHTQPTPSPASVPGLSCATQESIPVEIASMSDDELDQYRRSRLAQIARLNESLSPGHITRLVAKEWAKYRALANHDCDESIFTDYLLSRDTGYSQVMGEMARREGRIPALALPEPSADEPTITDRLYNAMSESDESLYRTFSDCLRSTRAVRERAIKDFSSICGFFTESKHEPLASLARRTYHRVTGGAERGIIQRRWGHDLSGIQLANVNGDRCVFFSPDASQSGRVRMTVICEDGPLGHATRDTYAQLLDTALDEGYRLPSERDPVERITQTPRFLRGAAINTEIEHLNTGHISQDQYRARVEEINREYEVPGELAELDIESVFLGENSGQSEQDTRALLER